MKYSLTLISILALLGVIHSQAGDVLPPRFNFDRYSAMVDKSPFAIATAGGLPEATPDFAKDLYVANAAHSPEGDLVTIASTSDQNFKKYLTTKEPVDGYGIVGRLKRNRIRIRRSRRGTNPCHGRCQPDQAYPPPYLPPPRCRFQGGGK